MEKTRTIKCKGKKLKRYTGWRSNWRKQLSVKKKFYTPINDELVDVIREEIDFRGDFSVMISKICQNDLASIKWRKIIRQQFEIVFSVSFNQNGKFFNMYLRRMSFNEQVVCRTKQPEVENNIIHFRSFVRDLHLFYNLIHVAENIRSVDYATLVICGS